MAPIHGTVAIKSTCRGIPVTVDTRHVVPAWRPNQPGHPPRHFAGSWKSIPWAMATGLQVTWLPQVLKPWSSSLRIEQASLRPFSAIRIVHGWVTLLSAWVAVRE